MAVPATTTTLWVVSLRHPNTYFSVRISLNETIDRLGEMICALNPSYRPFTHLELYKCRTAVSLEREETLSRITSRVRQQLDEPLAVLQKFRNIGHYFPLGRPQPCVDVVILDDQDDDIPRHEERNQREASSLSELYTEPHSARSVSPARRNVASATASDSVEHDRVRPAERRSRDSILIPDLVSFWECDHPDYISDLEFAAATQHYHTIVPCAHAGGNNLKYFELRRSERVIGQTPSESLDNSTCVAHIPIRHAELARIYYSWWNTMIKTVKESPRFLGKGRLARDQRALSYIEAESFASSIIIFHFRLNHAILRHYETTFEGGKEEYSPLVAYAATVIVGGLPERPVSYDEDHSLPPLNEEQKEQWQAMYEEDPDLENFDWRGWAGTDPYRQYFLGLPFEGPDYIREISDKLISSYIGFDRLEHGPGTLLRALALESIKRRGVEDGTAWQDGQREWMEKNPGVDPLDFPQAEIIEFLELQQRSTWPSGWDISYDALCERLRSRTQSVAISRSPGPAPSSTHGDRARSRSIPPSSEGPPRVSGERSLQNVAPPSVHKRPSGGTALESETQSGKRSRRMP